jgi:hypothetical protein
MIKFKPGDKVKIKQLELDGVMVLPAMLKYCNKIVTLTKVADVNYCWFIEEDEEYFWWKENWLTLSSPLEEQVHNIKEEIGL